MEHNILIIDDDTVLLESLNRVLSSLPYTVVTEELPSRGLKRLSEEDFSVVISDMRMAEMTGIELLHRASVLAPDTTRIMLTGHGDMQTAINAVNDANIYKFLTKPCPLPELTEALEGAVATYENARQSRLSKEKSMKDSLTGLPNRILLRDRLNLATARSSRGFGMTGVLFLDLDRFKPINDTHGHLAGDDVLREVASRFAKCLRGTDTCARFGGDEFVVLLTDISGPDDAMAAAKRLLASVQEPIEAHGNDGPIQVNVGLSIGISLHPEHTRSVNRLVEYADRAMYRAKRAGGGVEIHSAEKDL